MGTRAASLCGMPAVLDVLSSNPVVAGLTKGVAAPAGRRKKLSEIIPKADWWRMYIDRQHQKEALAKNSADPGKLYDTEQSEGFQKAMEDAYTKILDGDDMAAAFSKGPMKFSHYNELYGLVKNSVHVDGKVKKDAKDRVTFGIQPAVLATDVTSEMVNGRILLTENAYHHELVDAPEVPNTISYMANVPNPEGSGRVSVYATLTESVPLIDWALTTFQNEVTAAKTKKAQLTAIARVIRTLHIIHYFPDGNGRCNIYLLLPRLLLEYGFGLPIKLGKTCSPDTLFGLFNGCFTLDQIVAFLWNSQQLDAKFEALDV